MRAVVCAMAKNEHLYINEWVEHYVKLGFDTIYIYDNDDETSPLISGYINQKYLDKVVIKNIRGQHREHLQQDIYTGFYIKYGKTFDFCLFCDIDEFLFGIHNIKSFLLQPKFNYTKQIRIMWKLFGDNELITRDMSKSVIETFTTPVKSSLHRNLKQKGNLEIQGKMIVRGGLDNVVFGSPHFASFKRRDNVIPSVLPSGRTCFSKVAITEDYSRETIYLHHYMTKSLQEFIDQKLKRTDAVYGYTIPLDYYWRINKKTTEKLEYLKSKGIDIENSKYLGT